MNFMRTLLSPGSLPLFTLILAVTALMTGCKSVPKTDKAKPPSSQAKPGASAAPAPPETKPKPQSVPEEEQALVSRPADTSRDLWSYKLATLESVEAVIVKGSPTKAKVTVHGLLHDGATRINEVQHQRYGDGYVLTVTTARPKTAVASVALIPFERSVTLDLTGVPSGPCRISANGISTTLMVP